MSNMQMTCLTFYEARHFLYLWIVKSRLYIVPCMLLQYLYTYINVVNICAFTIAWVKNKP